MLLFAAEVFELMEKDGTPMKKNVGNVDRIIRILVGVILIAYAIPVGFPDTGWNWIGWIGIIPLATALLGICPAYSLLGLTTCKKNG